MQHRLQGQAARTGCKDMLQGQAARTGYRHRLYMYLNVKLTFGLSHLSYPCKIKLSNQIEITVTTFI